MGHGGKFLMENTAKLMDSFEAAYVIAMAFKYRDNPNLETARQLHDAVDALRLLDANNGN